MNYENEIMSFIYIPKRGGVLVLGSVTVWLSRPSEVKTDTVVSHT